jgi:hypothetical protein
VNKRIISAVLSCSFAFFSTVWLVPAKFLTGTIVLFGFVGNRIIVASDSRERKAELTTSSFDNDACKIIPLGSRMFFAGTGLQSYGHATVHPFAADFARDAFGQFQHAPNTEERAREIADRWGKLMTDFLERKKDSSFDAAVSGDLSRGIFADSTVDGRLVVYSENIHFAAPPTLPRTEVRSVWVTPSERVTGKEGQIIPYGFDEGFWEFDQGKTQRADMAHEQFIELMAKSPGIDEYKSMAMALEFAIKTAESWDTTNHIGGDVDSLELSGEGKMRWIHVKPACKGQIIQ